MKLIEPAAEYCEQIRQYREAFISTGDSMDGTGGLEFREDPKEWLEYVALFSDPGTVPETLVPATQLIYVREDDEKIVGMI